MPGKPNTPGKGEAINTGPLAAKTGTKSLKAWVDEWKSNLTATPDPALVAAAQDVLIVAADDASPSLKRGETFAIRPEFGPILDHMLWAIALMVRGEKFHDIEVATGISWTRLHACAGIDKKGFGFVWDAAVRLRQEGITERAMEHLREKAEKGVTKPVVVRVDKDMDEVKMVTQDSEALIAKSAEIASRARAEKSEVKNTTNIGQAVTYNIQAPQFILKNEPLRLIETNPLEGLKKSLE